MANQSKTPAGRALPAPLPAQREAVPPPYNLLLAAPYFCAGDNPAASAALASPAADACIEPLDFDAELPFLGARLSPRAAWPLLDRTKSAIRGAISERKRDPLNTP